MPLKGGAQEHFTLTNCSSCQEKMKQTAIKCSNEDAETKEAENKAPIKISKDAKENPKINETIKFYNENSTSDEEYLDDPPDEFKCDLMDELMTDPVLLPSGETVCRENIRRHLISTPHNPFTREHLTNDMLKPADDLRTKIALWKAEQKKAAREEIERKGEHKNVDDEEDIEFEDLSSEDADNPDKTSESEEESNTDEELERKKTSEIEDARSKDWEREYIVSTTCKFCKQIFPGKKHRKQHEKRNHSEKFNHYNCKVCDKKFTNSTALNYHLSIKHGVKRILICQGCKKELNSFTEYLEHKKTHRESYNGGMDAKCDKCGLRLSRKQMKRHHKNVHQQVLLKGSRRPVVLVKPTINFKCDNCSKAFNREENLIRHISEVHIQAVKFSCKHCGKLFKRKQHLDVHILDSHSPFFTNFECHICQKNFGQKKHRDRHVREVHEDKNYQCVLCKKTFKQNSDKERHIKEVHAQSEKNFKCPNCDKTFSRKFSQTRHTKSCY